MFVCLLGLLMKIRLESRGRWEKDSEVVLEIEHCFDVTVKLDLPPWEEVGPWKLQHKVPMWLA